MNRRTGWTPRGPESWGNVVTQDMFYRHRQAIEEAMAGVPELAAQADRPGPSSAAAATACWNATAATAPTVLVTLGSMAGTARDAVDALRDAGQAVGLVKLRLFRPLPVQALRAALAGVRDVWCSTATIRPVPAACCTRNCAPRSTAWPTRRACTAVWPAWAASTCRPQHIAGFARSRRCSSRRSRESCG
jgi:hypothetical protein